MRKNIRDKFEGCLLGVAVGDALGAPAEFMSVPVISRKFGVLKEMVGGGWLKLKPGEYTDDTAMMLCIAESLIENKGYNPDDIARRFVRWYRTKPKDIGGTTRRALARIDSGFSWKEAGDKNRPSNGSVMRCAPIGLFFAFDAAKLIEASIETSTITHAHPEATTSCIFINLMIAGFIQGFEKREIYKIAAEKIKNTDVNFFKKYINAPCGLTYETKPESGLAVDTTLLAISNFLNAKTFEEACIKAVNLGGDADTIGAVTGALAGAYWGAGAIPKRWLTEINPLSGDEISRLGTELFKLAAKS